MKILDRYLSSGFLQGLAYCLAIFFLLFIVIDVFNNLDDFLRQEVPVRIVGSYYLYMLPTIFIQVAPIATLVSILYTLGNLNRRNEIMAIKASGVSAFHILSPYFFMGILISFVILLLNETVVPQSTVTSAAIMDNLIAQGVKKYEDRAFRNVTMYKDNKMLFAREFDVLGKTLYDVIIIEDNPGYRLQSKLWAKKARYEEGRWIGYEVGKYQMNRRGDVVGEPEVSDTLELPLDEKPEDFIKEASQIQFMNSRQLKDYLHHMQGKSKKLVQELSVDLHYKIAFPFVTFVVVLIGAPLAMRSVKGHAIMGIGISFVIVVVYYAIDAVCLAMGKEGYLPPFFAAWFSNLLFAAVGLYLIRNTS